VNLKGPITITKKEDRVKRSIALAFVALLVFAGGIYALPAKVANWGLAWSDEFNGTYLDTVNNWSYDTVYPQPNAEKEHYKRACVEVSNGSLKIWSKLNTYGVQYASGRIDTHDKKIFTYGYFEAAIQGPVGSGSGANQNGPCLWSAVWILGNSINHGVAWPACGEMELYEQRTGPQQYGGTPGDNAFIGTCHYGQGGAIYNSKQYNYSGCLCTQFHKYGILWDSLYVEYYFDDVAYWGPSASTNTPSILQSVNNTAFHAPFFWIINSAIGGNYQGQNINESTFPLHMDLDFVRVCQKSVTVVKNPRAQYTPRAFALVNTSSAQLKVFDLKGKLVADYTGKVRMMRAGDNALKALPLAQSNNVYVVSLYDNGKCQSQRFVTTR
jgi:beta-glucanase (GH16 family)